MDRWSFAVAFAVFLLVGLLAPPAAATTQASSDDHTLSASPVFDLPEIDRYRHVVFSSGLPRADTDGILNQRTRAAVYAAIRESPGADLTALADAADVTESTARYHVELLREAGLVEGVELGGALRFAPAGTNADLAAATSAEPTRAVLEAVATIEPASVRDVAAATDRAPSTVSHHLSGLADLGLVERTRVGEAVTTRLTEETRAAVVGASASADD